MNIGWLIIQASAFSLSGAILLNAQTTNTQSSRASGEKVMLTGCVERADQLSGAGTAPHSTDPDSLTFVLVHPARGTTVSPSDVVGTSGSKSSGATGNLYRLDAAVPLLNPHVGREVEVTGVVIAGPGTTGTAGATSLATAPRVVVSEIRIVSETCPK